MSRTYPRILAAAERVVWGLTLLNIVYGAGILILLLSSVVAPDFTFAALAGRRAELALGSIAPMRALMAVGLAAVPLTHVILTRVRDLLATVRRGDPFITVNARRLNAVALAVLGLELLRIAVVTLVSRSELSRTGMRVGSSFSFTPWVAVLLLFVLAGVFEQGARMRADLEGTV